MTIGFEVYNESGVKQVDHTYRNYGFKTKGSRTCSTALGAPSSRYYAQFSVTSAGAPIVAIRPTNGNAIGLFHISVSGTTWTYTYIGASGATFDYYVFDYDAAMSGGAGTNVGLEVYDASGNTIYSSDSGSLLIAGGGAGLTNVSGLPSGRTYAGIQTATGLSQTYLDLGFPPIMFTASIYAVNAPSATQMTLAPYQFENYTVGSAGTDVVSPAPFLLVADVTSL